MTRRFVAHQKTSGCLYSRNRCAELQQDVQAGECLKWDLKKQCVSWLHGAISEAARREVLHASWSINNQKIHDGKWQLMGVCTVLHIQNRFNLEETWFGLQSQCMLFGIQHTKKCLFSIIKPEISRVQRRFKFLFSLPQQQRSYQTSIFSFFISFKQSLKTQMSLWLL